jgi:type I restriction enzyme S subunit
MNWLPTTLGKLLTLEYGRALPRATRDQTGSVLVAGSNGSDGFHDVALVRGPGIVVGRKGSAGKVTWYEEDFWPIDTTYFVEHDTCVTNINWLFYLLRSKKLERLNKSTGVPGLNRNDVYAESCLLPPLKEQCRIVEVLREADRLRSMIRTADVKSARILPALFLKMFGDPGTNPKGWPEKQLSKVIESVEAGWSASSEGRMRVGEEFGVLKVSAVTSGVFRPEENKAVIDLSDARSLIIPKRGDLLFSRANTRELVAASCVVESDHPTLFLSDKLWRVVPAAQEASAAFLKELFWCEVIRDRFRSVASGSSASMLNISQDAMLRTPIPVPPIQLQKSFEFLSWSVLDALNRARAAAEGIDRLWSNLLYQAFTGQLTANWREAHMKEIIVEMSQQARALNLKLPKVMEAI